MIEVKMSGVEDLRGKLQSLGSEGVKEFRSAARIASQLLAERIKENAARLDDQETKERIADNVAVQFATRTSRATGDIVYRTGIMGGARNYANTRENVRRGRAGKSYRTAGSSSNPGGDTWYWRFLEFGNSKSAARPFIRPAMDGSVGDMAEKFFSEAQKSLDRAIKREAKKGESK
jgi:HK97 gp10 family phage protein